MGFTQVKEAVWRYQGRIYVPARDSLRGRILEEVHRSEFTVHPGISKLYQDLKIMFWWSRMKSDVVELISKCLVCHEVKIEHQKPSGALQPLEIPEWKWESISMDSVMGLPRTLAGHDSIWVIVDSLTKFAHFLPIRANYPLEKLAQVYIQEIVRLHQVPSTIISYQDPRFTSWFWITL